MRVEQIEIELGGDAGRVVIGGVEHLDRLDQIDADDQRRAGARECARHCAGKPAASCGSKLPMVEPGKKPTRDRRALGFRRQLEARA